MTAVLLDREGQEHTGVDRPAVESRLSAGEFFWFDLHEPDEAEFALLRDVFAFHPLALQAAQHFGKRPKAEDFDEFVFLVLYGAQTSERHDTLVEVHCFYSEHFLVTVRRAGCDPIEELRSRYTRRPAHLERPLALLYRLFSGLSESFFPALDGYDRHIEAVEEAIFRGPSETQLQEIVAMRRRLARLRRVAGPQRDVAAQLFGGISVLPDSDEEAERYFRNVYDHLVRVTELIDGYRELLTGAMDVYLSSVSDRLNRVTTRLTIVATIALPLIVISGFFGQNFGWLVDRIAGWPEFLGLAIVLPVVFIALLIVYLRRNKVV
jgi:magnesium transporter